MRGFVLEKWAIGSLKESRAQNIARKPVWPQKKSYVHVFRNEHTCIDYCRGKVLRIYWYILSALTIYIDVTSPSFCGRSQLCNDPDTYQALGSVERRHRIYGEKSEWKNHDVVYVTTEMRTRFQIFGRMFFLSYVISYNELQILQLKIWRYSLSMFEMPLFIVSPPVLPVLCITLEWSGNWQCRSWQKWRIIVKVPMAGFGWLMLAIYHQPKPCSGF